MGALIELIWFIGIDLGEMAIGAWLVQFLDGPLSVLNLVKFG
ncbi:hypothetical protein [Sphingopyxis granuli]|nr:hypothetical protein [Sphingopyxis granuli]